MGIAGSREDEHANTLYNNFYFEETPKVVRCTSYRVDPPVGKQQRVFCCCQSGKRNGAIWGGQLENGFPVYTRDSRPICACAVHAGVIGRLICAVWNDNFTVV